MDFNFIKRLVQLVDASSVTDLEIEEENTKIKISKKGIAIQSSGSQPQQQYIYPAAAAFQQAEGTKAAETEAKQIDENLHEVRSPIVGTFYRASSPDSESFVQVGDIVSVGSTLCIIEAMKLMNEIESDVDGKIVKILVENGKPVEYNQPLFLIQVD